MIPVHSSIPRILVYQHQQWRCVAEDWPSPAMCETAIMVLQGIARNEPDRPDLMGNASLKALADNIMGRLEIEPGSVYGCSLIAEALP